MMSDIIGGLKHMLYIFSHPFDGFWTLKSEKKGNLKTAILFLVLLVVTLIARMVYSGYLFTSVSLASFSGWLLILAIILIVFLYVISNWVLTTLLEGSGNVKYIFISLMYSLTPIILLNVPITVLSHVLVSKEAAFISAISTFAILWSIFLLLAANSQVHEYTMIKSILTFIGTLIIMVIVIVLAILFFNLAQQVYVWVKSIIQEIVFRL